MNVEIGAEAALFLEKEYINGIAVALRNSVTTFFQCVLLKNRWFSYANKPALTGSLTKL
jgi:hypothetical protein